MGKKIAILLEEQYQVLEVWYPYYRLKEAGHEVHFVAPELKSYGSKEGYPAKAHFTFTQVNPENYDAVVIPGGFAPDFLRRSDAPAEFVQSMWEKGKVVAAICHGLWIPASAGILKGRKATCFYAIRHDIIHAGAEYVDQEVCVDGKLISSRKPDDLPAFVLAILQALEG